MARINPKLLEKIEKRLGVTKSRVYAVINDAASRYNLPAEVAALVVARDQGIAINRFATPEDWTLIRGSAPVSAAQAAPAASPAATSSRPKPNPGHARQRRRKKKRRARAAAQPAAQTDSQSGQSTARGNNKVWVVYGRDEARRKALFALLRSLGLNPIEWTSALAATKAGSPHISDVLDAGFRDSVATVVLFTPDDEAKLKDKFVKTGDPAHEKKLTGQPRPNVLFEAGMAFGRHPNETILVEVGPIRPISDLVGRHVVKLSNSIPSRHQLIVKLRAVGCPVDDTGDDWQTQGDFS